MYRLLHGPASSSQPLLVDRQLMASGIDRLTETHEREFSELLPDRFEASPYLIELAGHDEHRIAPGPGYRL